MINKDLVYLCIVEIKNMYVSINLVFIVILLVCISKIF